MLYNHNEIKTVFYYTITCDLCGTSTFVYDNTGKKRLEFEGIIPVDIHKIAEGCARKMGWIKGPEMGASSIKWYCQNHKGVEIGNKIYL
jgi:hypothetical protein